MENNSEEATEKEHDEHFDKVFNENDYSHELSRHEERIYDIDLEAVQDGMSQATYEELTEA